ncbi:hypothetical protein B0H14DRAFT_2652304 [Mycena olivaceomarginata]|nr:hypothetical protein B0H14DRAFT_2652304 [Mycena olivaceomarginata]
MEVKGQSYQEKVRRQTPEAPMQTQEVGGQHKLIWRHAWEPKLTFGRYAERGKYSTRKLSNAGTEARIPEIAHLSTACPSLILAVHPKKGDRLPSPQGNPMDRLSVAAEPVGIEMGTDDQSLMGYVAETNVKPLDRLCVAQELAHGDALGDNARICLRYNFCGMEGLPPHPVPASSPMETFSMANIMQANNAMSPFLQSDYASMPQLNANEMGMMGSGYYNQSQQYHQLLNQPSGHQPNQQYHQPSFHQSTSINKCPRQAAVQEEHCKERTFQSGKQTAREWTSLEGTWKISQANKQNFIGGGGLYPYRYTGG